MRPRNRAQKRWWRTMLVTAAVLVMGVKRLDAAISPATTCAWEAWRGNEMLYCSAAVGLICVARRAGTNAATFVITTTAAAAEMMTSGSVG